MYIELSVNVRRYTAFTLDELKCVLFVNYVRSYTVFTLNELKCVPY